MLSAMGSPRVFSQSASQPQSQSQSQAQPPAQSQSQPQPTFRVGATYVRVDAYVTKDDKPVTDLKPEEVEVYEDGVRQTIRNFELVSVAPGFLQTSPRQDPRTVAEMREKVADPRRRVFILFLDTYHSQIGSSMSARKAFQRFLERLVGPDDLVAGMTPEMSPESLTFGSRTEALDSFLNSVWGRRDSLRQTEEEEYLQTCFEPRLHNLWIPFRDRRRTKLLLDSLEALVRQVGDLREERKAIIAVSEGWELYREDLSLMNNPDGSRPLHLGPLVTKSPSGATPSARDSGSPMSGDCDKIFLELANMETVQQFHALPDEANRANASFYFIDPRGLPASDDLLNGRSPKADLDMLRTKQNQMRELSDRTDGMALFNSNDLDKELTRIAQDLSSYYLFGYDSTNAKLDGTYRSLTVKVKRPGILVRARHGYRAAILPAAGSPNSRTGGATKNPVTNDVTSAVGAIMGTRADLPVRLRATAVRLLDTSTSSGPAPRASEMRLVVELDPKLAMSDAWRQGGVAHFIVKGEGTDAPLSADATLKPGERILTATIALPTAFSLGDYRVQMRLNATSHTDALSDSTTVQVAAPGLIGSPALLRRGPSTGTAYLATADVRFRRADRLRLEAPSRLPAAQVHVTAVDQRGQPLNLPIQMSDRQDGTATLIVADISLAPLAPGGYAIVLTGPAEERVIVPFQLIP
jgi:VWFA-related protein